jgi:hypothetical protein
LLITVGGVIVDFELTLANADDLTFYSISLWTLGCCIFPSSCKKTFPDQVETLYNCTRKEMPKKDEMAASGFERLALHKEPADESCIFE